jgi:GTPase SAR1 family protein
MTLGIEFKTNQIANLNMKLQVWDVPGRHQFQASNVGYYRESQGALISFDIANRSSFESLPFCIIYLIITKPQTLLLWGRKLIFKIFMSSLTITSSYMMVG